MVVHYFLPSAAALSQDLTGGDAPLLCFAAAGDAFHVTCAKNLHKHWSNWIDLLIAPDSREACGSTWESGAPTFL